LSRRRLGCSAAESFYKEIDMFLQSAPADTTSYMILGFSLIFGTIGLYLLSLYIRSRNLHKDLAVLAEVEPRREGD
jgi:hypothetical protein